jgi:inorganic pyrophosphatase
MNMKIVEYFSSECPEHWLSEIRRCDWRAGQFLHQLLRDGQFHSLLGEKSKLLLLTEGNHLIAFCTYAQRDEIPLEALTPWAGFVYTFPQHRGKRRMGKLLEHVYRLAKADGFPCVYISTDHTGLYEKYGCTFWKTMQDAEGSDCRIYRMEIEHPDYSGILGRQVSGTVDRPLGSAHARHPDMIYPINYGYVEGITVPDGEWQDAYILGVDEPIQEFTGKVIGVIHRLDDVEDKWVVCPENMSFSEKEITEKTDFQEKFFKTEILV